MATGQPTSAQPFLTPEEVGQLKTSLQGQSIKAIERTLANQPAFVNYAKEDPDGALALFEDVQTVASDYRPPEGPVRKFVRPTLEGVGAVVGIAAGTPAGPVGQAGGAVLGMAMGSSLADFAEAVAGEQATLESPEDILQRTGENLQLAGTLEAAGQVISRGVGTVAQKVLAPFVERIGPGVRTLVDYAERLGVKLTPGEITHSPTIEMIESVLSRFPLSADFMKRFNLERVQSLVSERNRLLDSGGSAKTIEQVGRDIRAQIDALMRDTQIENATIREEIGNALLKKMGSAETLSVLGKNAQDAVRLYADTKSQLGNAAFDKAAEIAGTQRVTPRHLNDTAQRIFNEAIQDQNPKFIDAQFKALIEDGLGSGNPAYERAIAGLPDIPANASPAVRASIERERQRILDQVGGPGFTLEQLKIFRNRIRAELDSMRGSKKFGVKGAGPAVTDRDFAHLVQLKKALDDDIAAFSEEIGGGVKEFIDLGLLMKGERNLVTKNKAFQDFLNDRPQDAIEGLLKGAKVEDIRLLKTATGENFPAVQQALVKTIFSEEQVGALTAAGIRQRINRFGPDVLQEVMGPTFVKDADQVARFIAGEIALPVANPVLQHLVRISPKNVATDIIRSVTPQGLRQLEGRLGASTMKHLREGHLTHILEMKGNRLVPDDIIKAFQDIDEPIRKQLFKDAPETLEELGKLVQVMQRIQGPLRQGNLSPFEKGSRAGAGLLTFIQGNVMLRDPIRGVEMILRAATFGKLLLVKAGRQWLTEGFKLPVGTEQTIAMLTRLTGILEGVPERPKITPLKPSVARVNQADDFVLNPQAGQPALSQIGAR